MQNKKFIEVAKLLLQGRTLRSIAIKMDISTHLIPNYLLDNKGTELWEEIKNHYLKSRYSKTLDQVEILVDAYLNGDTLGQASKKASICHLYARLWATVYEKELGSKYSDFIATLELKATNRHSRKTAKGIDFTTFPKKLTHKQFLDKLCERELAKPVYYYLHHAVDYGIEVIWNE